MKCELETEIDHKNGYNFLWSVYTYHLPCDFATPVSKEESLFPSPSLLTLSWLCDFLANGI